MQEQIKKTEYGVFALLKIGKKEHIESFQKGEMYFNTLQYFRYLEEEQSNCQGDKYEGYSELFQPDMGTLEINGKEIKDISGPIMISLGLENQKNIFCMYSIIFEKEKREVLKINPKNFSFGEYSLIVRDVDEFLRRVCRACDGRELEYGFVEYVDINKFHGQYGPFKKPKKYSYQNELRFVLKNSSLKPFILKIGDISDITVIIKTSELNSTQFLLSNQKG